MNRLGAVLGVRGDKGNPSTREIVTEDPDFKASLGYMVRLCLKRESKGRRERGRKGQRDKETEGRRRREGRGTNKLTKP